MFKYLKDYQYYIDCYDIYTIKECLSFYIGIQNRFNKERNTEKFKEFSKEEFDEQVCRVSNYMINAIKTKRYKHKKETIQKWMEHDRIEQEKYDNAVPPRKVLCKQCLTPTEFTFKDLWHINGETSCVLFMFECPSCKKRQALYDDGTEWRSKTYKCPECNSTLNSDCIFHNNILTTVYSCPSCAYKKEEVDDFNKDEKEWKEREERENKLLEKYRSEFCDNKRGEELLSFYECLSRLGAELKEKERKGKDPLIQKARQLKKLTAIQIKKLIEDAIEKEGYNDLKFGKPEIGRYVIIDFSVIDIKEDREEYVSQNTLRKLIKRILEDTNWRLMSEGISYRLGILTGRLKAYEQEEDLVKLVRKQKA